MANSSRGRHLPYRLADLLPPQSPPAAYLYKFGFPIECSTDGRGFIAHQRAGGGSFRFYWPFRDDNYDRRVIEQVNLERVPFPSGTVTPARDAPVVKELRISGSGCIDANALRIDCPQGGEFGVGQRLIRLIRWATRQWWIERGDPDGVSYLRNSFDIRANGERLNGVSVLTALTGRARIETLLTPKIYDWCSARAACGFTAPPSILWILDGMFSLTTNQNLERSVVETAIGCEMLLLDHLDRVVRRKKLPRSGARRFPSGQGLDTQIRRGIPQAFGDSFEEEEPAAADALFRLSVARGHVAHGKPPRVVQDGRSRPMTFADQFAAVDGARTLVNWFAKRGLHLEPVHAASGYIEASTEARLTG